MSVGASGAILGLYAALYLTARRDHRFVAVAHNDRRQMIMKAMGSAIIASTVTVLKAQVFFRLLPISPYWRNFIAFNLGYQLNVDAAAHAGIVPVSFACSGFCHSLVCIRRWCRGWIYCHVLDTSLPSLHASGHEIHTSALSHRVRFCTCSSRIPGYVDCTSRRSVRNRAACCRLPALQNWGGLLPIHPLGCRYC